MTANTSEKYFNKFPGNKVRPLAVSIWISSAPPALSFFESNDQSYLDPSIRIWAHNQLESKCEGVVYFELLKLIL
jgi:hypothetical protein